jgi:hypothetical protein
MFIQDHANHISFVPRHVKELKISYGYNKNMNKPKTNNNPWNLQRVPFETTLVKFVDHIIDTRIALGRPTHITNEKHWELLMFIMNGYHALYPEYANAFLNHMKWVRANAKQYAVSKEKGGAQIQHLIEVPEPLMNMISRAFPEQKWDKKFILKFAQRLPALKGANTL